MQKKNSFLKWACFGMMAVLMFASCGRGCKKQEGGAPTKAGVVEAIDLIPADHNFVLSINWKKLSANPEFAQFVSKIPEETKGVSQDIDTIFISLQLNSFNQAQPPQGVAIFSGKMDEKKIATLIEEAAKKEGKEVKKETYEGSTIYISTKDANMGFVILSPSQALGGPLPILKQSIDLSKGKGSSLKSNAELAAFYKKRDASKLLWGAGILPKLPSTPDANDASGMPNPMAALQGLQTFSLSIDYTNELSLDLTGNTQEVAQAQNLANLVNSYKTIFGASVAAKDPSLGQLIQGLQLTQQDKSISIALRVPKEIVVKLTQQLNTPPEAAPLAPVPPPGGAESAPAPAPAETAPAPLSNVP